MDLTLDYFANFDLQRGFFIDSVELGKRHRALQQTYHPDRFVGTDDNTHRRAIQTAAYINEAFNTLNSPLKRAIYLLQLEGMDPLSPTNTHMPHDFLLQQMFWRERMEELGEMSDFEQAEEGIGDIYDDLLETKKTLQKSFAETYSAGQWSAAETIVRKMQFIEKLMHEVDEIEDRLA